MEGIKSGQLWGHSCFRIWTKTMFSLLKYVRCLCKASSSAEFLMMMLTINSRMPGGWGRERSEEEESCSGVHTRLGEGADLTAHLAVGEAAESSIAS